MIEQLSKLRKSLLFIAAFLLTSLHMTATNRDSLALTPPMGFMTWNKYKEDINEQLIRQIADKMAADGYAEAGYKYIFIDDAWQEGCQTSITTADGLCYALTYQVDKNPSGI